MTCTAPLVQSHKHNILKANICKSRRVDMSRSGERLSSALVRLCCRKKREETCLLLSPKMSESSKKKNKISHVF